MCSNYTFLLLLLIFLPAQQRPLKMNIFTGQTLSTALYITNHSDEGTGSKVPSRFCTMPSNAAVFSNSKKSTRWDTTRLTYKIQNFSYPFTKPQVELVFENIVKSWTSNVNLKITATTEDEADIDIYFTIIDGIDSILGYAYLPKNGDIYFDVDEKWTLDASLAEYDESYTFFNWVVAHELGHALGLKHSKREESIMHESYSAYTLTPTAEDVKQLQKLYGPALNNQILCEGAVVDAILKIDSKQDILIKKDLYWIISDGSLQSGPFQMESLFPGYPNNIDSAISVGKRVYLFKNHVFFAYQGQRKSYRRKLISTGFEGVPSNIDASFYDPHTEMIYFFKGTQYYGFDITNSTGKRLIISNRDINSDWKGLPDEIEAATLQGNNVLFIKDAKCYTVELQSKQLVNVQNCSFLYKC